MLKLKSKINQLAIFEMKFHCDLYEEDAGNGEKSHENKDLGGSS